MSSAREPDSAGTGRVFFCLLFSFFTRAGLLLPREAPAKTRTGPALAFRGGNRERERESGVTGGMVDRGGGWKGKGRGGVRRRRRGQPRPSCSAPAALPPPLHRGLEALRGRAVVGGRK